MAIPPPTMTTVITAVPHPAEHPAEHPAAAFIVTLVIAILVTAVAAAAEATEVMEGTAATAAPRMPATKLSLLSAGMAVRLPSPAVTPPTTTKEVTSPLPLQAARAATVITVTVVMGTSMAVTRDPLLPGTAMICVEESREVLSVTATVRCLLGTWAPSMEVPVADPKAVVVGVTLSMAFSPALATEARLDGVILSSDGVEDWCGGW